MKALLTILTFLYLLPAGNSQVVYVVDGLNDLYRMNMDNCEKEFVVSLDRSACDLAFHPDGSLYGVSCNTGSGNFYKIDTLTGITTNVTLIPEPGLTSLTIGADGIVYTMGIEGNIWSYNLVSNLAINLGDVGYSAEGDLTFYNGELYVAAQGDRIIRINLDDPPNSDIIIDEDIPGTILGIVSNFVSCNAIKIYAITGGDFSEIYLIDFDNNALQQVCVLDIFVGGGASTAEFLGSVPIEINNLLGSNPDCHDQNGEVTVPAATGYGTLQYAINESPFQSGNKFDGLSAGTYTLYVQDQAGCIDSNEIVLVASDTPVIDKILTQPVTCHEANGLALVSASGGTGLLSFSLDSLIFQPGGQFENLDTGHYHVIVRDANGCVAEEGFEIHAVPAAEITSANSMVAHCGLADGSITVSTDMPGVTYSIDNVNFQTSPFFQDLPSGIYMVSIVDNNGCVDTVAVTIFEGPAPQIEAVQVSHETCTGQPGSISIEMSTAGNYNYSLDNVLWQGANTFQNLSAGMYTVYITDENGCTANRDVEVNTHSSFSLQSVSSTPADCGDNTGTLSVNITGGAEPFQFHLNDIGPQPEPYFEALNSGTYLLHIRDAYGCTLDSMLTIPQARCALFIPNVFSPNGDGVNDLFRLHTSSETEIMITRFLVFDRWGNNVFEKYDIPIHAETGWWDGTYKRWTMNPGNYAYFIEARFANDETETYKGSITLIR